MFLTKINKIIWVVFLLPCINSQSNVFTFDFPSYTYDIYANVTSTQETKLTCMADYRHAPAFVVIDLINNVSDIVVNNYVLLGDHSKYNYTYYTTSYNEVGNVLTINHTNKYTTELYLCITEFDIFALNLNVYYPPEQPTCTTIQGNEVLTLICESEIGKPAIDMTISSPARTYASAIMESNDTHTSQSITIPEYKENITCTTTYNFIQKNVVYTTEYKCVFDNIVPTVTPTPTMDVSNSTVTPTPTMDVSNSTVDVYNSTIDVYNSTVTDLYSSNSTTDTDKLTTLIYPTNMIDALVSSSTITKYSILTLIMVILSKSI